MGHVVRTQFVLFATLLVIAEASYAQIDYTLGNTAGGNLSWSNASNWNPIGVPGTSLDDRVDLAVPLQSDLRLSLGTNDFTLAGISLGSTLAPCLSEIAGTTGKLLLNNSLSDVVLVSLGVAGVTNRISTDLVLGDTLVLSENSTQDIALTGDIGLTGADQTILQNMIGGQTLTLGSPGSFIRLYDTYDPAAGRTLAIKVFKDNAGLTAINTVIAAEWDDNGSGGGIVFGAVNNNPAATFVLSQTQMSQAGVQINRQGYVLAADGGLGTGVLDIANNNNPNWGCEIRSDDDSRMLANSKIIATNNFAFTGDKSLSVTGVLTQRSNRVVGNNVAAGKAVLLPGTDSTPAIAISERLVDGSRTWIMDGTGTTVVSGRVVNNLEDDTSIVGSLWKRGTGRLELNNPNNTIRGEIQIQGGLLAFGASGAWGSTTGIRVLEGGGIAYEPGVAAPGFSTLASRIATDSTGFLALTAVDQSRNLDFTTTLSHVPALGVGADGDVVFTGTVTPSPASGYHWGGISGTLTLGENASVGPNNVAFGNGGLVRVAGTQTYTGATSIEQVLVTTAQRQIAARSGNRGTPELLAFASTVEVSTLADGGLPSPLGASSQAATNLVIDGGVLRIQADASASTNRLFTIGSNGGTLESNGPAEAVLARDGGRIVSAGSGLRTLTLAGSSSAHNLIAGELSNGVDAAADLLSLHKTGQGTWVLSGDNSYGGSTVVAEGQLFINGDQTSGTGSYLAQAGGTIGGSGTLGGMMTVQASGTLAPGFGIGELTANGDVSWESGGNLNWQIYDANGTPGSGWDLLTTTGALVLTGTSADPFSINLWSLSEVEPLPTSGNARNFRNSSDYTWTFASAGGGITGFSADGFRVNVVPANGTAGFSNVLNDGTFQVVQDGNDLNLVFTSAHPTTDIVIDIPTGILTQAEAGYPSISDANSLLKTGAGILSLNVANTYAGPTTIAEGSIASVHQDGLLNTEVTVETDATLAIAPGIVMNSPGIILNGGTLWASSMLFASETGCQSLTINSGTIANAPSLTIDAGGRLTLSPASRVTVAVGSLALTTGSEGGLVDLGAGELTFAAGGMTATELRADIIAGRSGGTWSGTTGIMSTTAAGSGGTRAVGYVMNSDGSGRVSFAAPGDTDLSGAVNVFDLVGINSSGRYGTGGVSTWSQGDFNYDGVTNVFDLVGVNTAGSYGQGNYFPSGAPAAGNINAVPEPIQLDPWATALFAGGVLFWLRRPHAKPVNGTIAGVSAPLNSSLSV
jgi:autotransporter-associated beta strand protein